MEVSGKTACACESGTEAVPAATQWLESLGASSSLSGTPPVPPLAELARSRTARSRLWEISPEHHCVLLGAAFDERELRQLFRRTSYTGWETAFGYQLHSTAVSLAKRTNEFSRIAQRKLDDRYEPAVTHFRRASSATQVFSLWRSWLELGNPVPAYWAAITHPACDAQTSDVISQEMHMLAQSAFAWRRSAERRTRTLEEANTGLASRLGRAETQVLALRGEAARLRARSHDCESELKAARARVEETTRALSELEHGERVAELHARIDRLSTERAAAQTEAAALREALAQARAAAQTPSPTTHGAAAGPGAQPPCAASPDLCATRVLCVGGRTGLVSQYRSVIERARGAFLYHDGGLEDHLSRLPALLCAADAVVCLSGDLSHAAYHTVKRYCKVKAKPCALVGQSSITAVMAAVDDLAGALRDRQDRAGHPLVRTVRPPSPRTRRGNDDARGAAADASAHDSAV